MAKTFRYRLQPGTYERKSGGRLTVWQVTEVDAPYHEFSGEGVERLGEVVDGELARDDTQDPNPQTARRNP